MANNLPIDIQNQYRQIMDSCGYYELKHWTTIRVQGADRSKFLHNMCSNEINKLGQQSGIEAFFTDVKGKIIAHSVVLVLSEEILLLTVPDQADTIVNHLDRYIITEDVQLLEGTEQFSWLMLLGGATNQVLNTVFELEACKFKQPWENQNIQSDDIEYLLVNAETISPQAVLLGCPHSLSASVIESLDKQEIPNISPSVWETIRLESGFPLYQIDFDGSNLPQEVDRDDQAISFNKGCYLGQETIARIDALGHVNQQMVTLQFEGERIPEVGIKVMDGEKEVGTVTSTCWSPRLHAPLAFAMVRRGSNLVGHKLVSSLGEAVVIDCPQSV